MVENLLHIFRSHPLRGDRDLLRRIHELVGQLHDPQIEGGGEEQILALIKGGQTAQDETQIGDKAHVKHAVGLVDDQHLDLFEAVNLLFEVVDQPARSADDDVGPLAERITLLHVIYAAIDTLDGKAAMATQDLGVLLDLHHQFPCWRKDQCTGMFARLCGAVIEESREEGNQEGRCFAGPGLGLAGNVLSGKADGEGMFLDRGTAAETRLGNTL